MKWVLLIFLLSPTKYMDFKPTAFETEARCLAAAEAFVERYPAFEWRRWPRDRIERPVVRSYVECLPANEYERRKEEMLR